MQKILEYSIIDIIILKQKYYSTVSSLCNNNISSFALQTSAGSFQGRYSSQVINYAAYGPGTTGNAIQAY